MIRWRRLLGPVVVAGVLAGYAVAVPTGLVYASTADYRRTVATVPSEPVGIVMGAGLNPDGSPSGFLAARLDLAASLYRLGKIKVVLVSGDNSRRGYDEPTAMMDYLIDRWGVPFDKIVRDYAGFDTWATCDRAVKVFGVDHAIVITQDFHLPRAVALCRAAGITAYGVGNDSMPIAKSITEYGYAREVVAAMKATVTLETHPKPRFLGPADDAVRLALAN